MYTMIYGPSSWRQLIRLENYDPCWIAKHKDLLPTISALKKYYKKHFPNMPNDCPIQPGKYYAANVTVLDEKDDSYGSEEINNSVTVGQLPNGIYRHLIKVFNKNDPFGFMLYWQVEIYNSMGENF